MARPFSLAGLLRLRRLQRDQAAGDLAAANAAVREHEESARQARGRIADLSVSAESAAAMNAISAARASSRSMLMELDIIGCLRHAAAAESNTRFTAAHAQSVRLEKLENRHREVAAADDLRAEQTVLDEIATTAWRSGHGQASA